MIVASLATLLLALSVSSVEAQTTSSCSGQNNVFQTPGSDSCMTNWSRGNTYNYPADFEGILSEVTIYACPSSGKRVIISNGIPDHDVVQGNPNSPCEIRWAVSMPLNPTIASSKSEPPSRGIIAMAINGVPTYGAQEGGSTNAVEPDPSSQIQDAQFWYGHAARNNDWHFHNPHMGQVNPSENDLLGYALDGFPIYGPLPDASILDSCNGQIVNGQYQYHVRGIDQVDASLDYCNGNSPETNWNYIIGCYSGTLSDTQVLDSNNFSLPSDCVEDVTVTSSPPSAAPTIAPTMVPSPSFMTDLCNAVDVLGQTIFLAGVGACWRIQLAYGGTLEGDFGDPSCSKDESDWQSTDGIFSLFDSVSLSAKTAAFSPGTNGYSGTFQFKEDSSVTQPMLEILDWNQPLLQFTLQVTIPTCSADAICPTMKVDL